MMEFPLSIAVVLPDFGAGGAQRAMLGLTAQLDRKSFDPCVIAFDASGPFLSLVPSDLRVISLGRARARAALLALSQELKKMRPRIVISTMTYVNFGVLLLKPLLHRDTRIIVREANVPSGHSQSAIGRFCYWIGYRLLYPWADVVICPTRAIADELVMSFAVPRARITVIPNPVDEAGLRANAAVPRRDPGAGLRFVAVGRLSYQKGYDRLLADFAALPADSKLTIFGEGKLRQELKAHIAALGLEGRVELRGFDSNVAPWIAGADALLLSSRWEGLPNVVLEALACGTPIIATPESGGIVEIAEAAPRGAVQIAASGKGFVTAMRETCARIDLSLRPSRLPAIYRMEDAGAAFARILLSACRPVIPKSV